MHLQLWVLRHILQTVRYPLLEMACKVGIIQTPDLNGLWKGHFLSSYDGHTTQKLQRLRLSKPGRKCVLCLGTELPDLKA